MTGDDEQPPSDAARPAEDGRLAVFVLAEMCATCVFRPGNLMGLQPGRLRGMVDDSVQEQTAITCHSTLYGGADHQAVCRGFFDRHADDVWPLRLAHRTGRVRWQDPPAKDNHNDGGTHADS